MRAARLFSGVHSEVEPAPLCLVHRRAKPRNPLHDVRHGRAHRQLRAVLASRVRAGLAVCARCASRSSRTSPGISVTSTMAGRAPIRGRSTLVAIGRRIEDLVREHAATGTHWRSWKGWRPPSPITAECCRQHPCRIPTRRALAESGACARGRLAFSYPVAFVRNAGVPA